MCPCPLWTFEVPTWPIAGWRFTCIRSKGQLSIKVLEKYWKILQFYILVYQALRFRGFCCSGSQLQNWALCKPSFEPKSFNSQKKENLQWEKCRYITGREKTFSDTVQYFHLKHLKIDLSVIKNTFFPRNGVSGPNR